MKTTDFGAPADDGGCAAPDLVMGGRMVALVLGLCAAALLVLGLYPELDLRLAGGGFRPAPDGFTYLRLDPAVSLARKVSNYLPGLAFALLCLLALIRRFSSRLRAAFEARDIAFALLVFALGPGLAVNFVLKSLSGRPRPVHITDYLGSAVFRPFWDFSGSCITNCSFSSGEAAAATAMIAFLPLVGARWRVLAAVLVAAFIPIVSFLRIYIGAHFPSDVIFSIAVTLLVIWGLRAALYTRAPRWADARAFERWFNWPLA